MYLIFFFLTNTVRLGLPKLACSSKSTHLQWLCECPLLAYFITLIWHRYLLSEVLDVSMNFTVEPWPNKDQDNRKKNSKNPYGPSSITHAQPCMLLQIDTSTTAGWVPPPLPTFLFSFGIVTSLVICLMSTWTSSVWGTFMTKVNMKRMEKFLKRQSNKG